MQNTANKLTSDSLHVQAALEQGNIELALASAKRASRHARLLVQLLAAHRDATAPGEHKP